MIRNQIYTDLNIRLILNGLGFTAAIIVVYIIGLIGAYFINYKHAWVIALLWTAALFIIGIATKIKGYQEEARIIDVPWEVDSVGSYVARREVLKITGTAYVVSEILMASATCLLHCMECIKKISMLSNVTDDDIAREMKKLQIKARGGSRFIELKTVQVNAKVIKPLLLAGVIWYKKEGEVIKIGINRKYDNYEFG